MKKIMSELQIENPTQIASYPLSWKQIKEHILIVVKTFPNEYTIIKNAESENAITLLNIPVSPAGKAIAKDQIIYVTISNPNETQTSLKMEITNENNKIDSYTELERDKKSLEVFKLLLQKSIAGTLIKTVSNINARAKQANSGQGILQLIILIVALIAIFIGAKALFM